LTQTFSATGGIIIANGTGINVSAATTYGVDINFTSSFGVRMGSTAALGWTSANVGGTIDTTICREGATGKVQIAAGTGCGNTGGILDVAKLAPAGGTQAITGTLTVSAIASSGAAQTGYLCYNTTGGVITYDSGATCLVSTMRFKRFDADLDPQASLSDVMRLRPIAYHYTRPDLPRDAQIGLAAENVWGVDPRMAALDDDGLPRGNRDAAIIAKLVSALQALKADYDDLRKEVSR
jgi:hypothetical protein